MARLNGPFLVVIALLIAASALLRPVAAEPVQLVEQKIKAGLLYNFLKYTQWPAPARTTMTVCLLGGDPFDGALAPMSGRTVNEHTIAVRAIDDAKQAGDCAMLVVHANRKDAWSASRAALAATPVLTVSDLEGFSTQGGMIEFARIDDRIGVKINLETVNAARLQVHDRMLKLATVVRAAGQ